MIFYSDNYYLFIANASNTLVVALPFMLHFAILFYHASFLALAVSSIINKMEAFPVFSKKELILRLVNNKESIPVAELTLYLLESRVFRDIFVTATI